MERRRAANGSRGLIEASASLLEQEIGKLVALSGIAVAAFFITHAAAATNHARRQLDAATWYRRGVQARAAGQLDVAVSALRRATAIDHDRTDYRLALASALSEARLDDSARQVLLGVREITPEDPEVNEQLARLEARSGNVEEAIRYYRAALFGRWPADRASVHRELRVELVQYLLQHGQPSRALSELIILIGNIPDDVAVHNQLGDLLMHAGDAHRGHDQFRKALRLQPKNTASLTGAAMTAFAIGDYRTAQRYFQQLPPSITGASTEVTEAAAITELVFRSDPLAPGLPIAQRRARLDSALAATSERLTSCAGPSHVIEAPTLTALVDEARALRGELARRRVRDRDGIERGLALVDRIVATLAERCSPATIGERALRIIARRHETVDAPL